MICRTCLRQATRLPRPASLLLAPSRPFSTTFSRRNSAAAPAADATAAAPATTPAADDGPVLSSCPKGTVLSGLNFLKDKQDPVALADSEYPDWLWTCLKVRKKAGGDGADADGGDEFSKSKKQRRLAAKKLRKIEAEILASGDLSALAPKIPLQHQTVNLPAAEDGTAAGAVHSIQAREDLRQAMRKERKAQIKERNYLKSMWG